MDSGLVFRFWRNTIEHSLSDLSWRASFVTTDSRGVVSLGGWFPKHRKPGCNDNWRRV